MNSILESRFSFLLTNEMLSRVKFGVLLLLSITLCLSIDIYYFGEGKLTVIGLIAVELKVAHEMPRVTNRIADVAQKESLELWTVFLAFMPLVSYAYLLMFHNEILPIFVAILIATIFATDTFALLIGRAFGKNGIRLAAKISPNKSLIGALGGCTIGTVIFVLLSIDYLGLSFLKAIICGVFVTVSSVVGDLLQSYIKRCAGVKDSGSSLGAHGGFWDRFDSHALPPLVAFSFASVFAF